MGHGCHDCGSPNSCDCVVEEKAPIPKDDGKKWAIQDSETKQYWNCINGLKPLTVVHPTVYPQYPLFLATDIARSQRNENLRIVPAPTREMTDVECLDWLTGAFVKLGFDAGMWQVTRWNDGTILHGTGATAYDAIRAARRKLEGK